jgi:hypothetical protein
MYVGKDNEFWPVNNPPDYSSLVTGGYSWNFTIYISKKTKLGESARFALFYVGPCAIKLINNHVKVCKYFATDGGPRWPPITGPIEDIVQCSGPIELKFVSLPTA